LFTLFTTMDKTRDRILTCACDLYLDDGLEGFSMRKLARSVGVTAPALYRHFHGKEQVLLEVVGEAYRSLIQYLHPALGGRTPEERFHLAGQGYVDFALEHPRYYEILYSYTEFLGLDELPEELRKLVAGIDQFWLDRVRECMDAGVLKRDDPELVGRTFWAMSHGLLSIYHRKILRLTEEELRVAFQGAMRQLMTGVGAEEAPSPA
jgi:AcrR family transcriptional regulator